MLSHDFSDWYWGKEDGTMWSSRLGRILTTSDPKPEIFTRWPRDEAGVQTDDALRVVLEGFGIAFDLDALKASLKKHIDAQAEGMRQEYITPGSGQAMEYRESQDQAVAALAIDPKSPPVPADFPMVAAGIGIDVDPQTGKPSVDVLGSARAIVKAKTAWETFGAAIRAARLKTKAAVDAATDAIAARTAAAAFAVPSA